MNEADRILEVHRREARRVEAVIEIALMLLALLVWAVVEVVRWCA